MDRHRPIRKFIAPRPTDAELTVSGSALQPTSTHLHQEYTVQASCCVTFSQILFLFYQQQFCELYYFLHLFCEFNLISFQFYHLHIKKHTLIVGSCQQIDIHACSLK